MRRALAVTIGLFALVFFLALVRYSPPPPAPADAPKERFSAARARVIQTKIVNDNATRWVGTPGNARARELIIAELERLGWAVETQTARSCTYHGMCARVTNIIARLEGSEPYHPGVLLSAHYDSVPVSPGASDDGVGATTLLETARALSEGPTKPKRNIIVLIDDGEEAGLLGADAFVRGHPLARSVAYTINVDSRGSHGPSQMFETSQGNLWLVSLMASHLERPVTTSLYYEVYKRMPNDTDFTATKTTASGINFANTAGIQHYHTPLDNLDSADQGTLQHHGDHVLGMARALADSKGPGADLGKDAVWFDVLAFGVVSWPERWSKLIAALAVLLLLRHARRYRVWDRGLAVFLPALLSGVAFAFAAGWILKTAGAVPAFWIAHPWPALLAIHAAAGAGGLLIMLLFAAEVPKKRSRPESLFVGTWLGWGILGALTAVFAPGVSYLFIVPTTFAALAGLLPLRFACVIPAAVASVLVLSLAPSIYEALGFALAPLVALPTILLATTLAPMLSDLPAFASRRLPVAIAGTSAVAMIVAIASPKFSAERPQRVNVVYRQDVHGVGESTKRESRVFLDTSWGPSSWGAPPAAMRSAIAFGASSQQYDRALPWTLPALFVSAPPDAPSFEPPRFVQLADSEEAGRRRIRGTVLSPRGAPTIAMFFPKGRRVEVKVDGVYAFPRPVATGTVVGLLAVPKEGVSVELSAPAVAGVKVDFTLLDRSFDVPPGSKAEAAVQARPAEATRFQDGDVTIVTTELSL